MGRADRPDGFDLRPTRDLVRHVGVRRIMRNGVDAGLGHDSPGLYSCAMAVLQSIFIDDSGRVPARSHSRQAGPNAGGSITEGRDAPASFSVTAQGRNTSKQSSQSRALTARDVGGRGDYKLQKDDLSATFVP